MNNDENKAQPQPAQAAPDHSALIAHWLKLGDQSERDGFHGEAAEQKRQRKAAKRLKGGAA